MIKLILTIVFSAFAFVSMGANECADVVLHEWDTDGSRIPRLVKDETGREEYDGTEKQENLVTWVYDGTSFTPVAKVTADDRYTIVHDYLGTPTQAYDSNGGLVWEMMLDVYGKVMDESHGDRMLVPFRYQGQYEDVETGLYYNRFRYYSPEMGMYISSDPIGLAGNNPTLYGYVQDVNIWLDKLGLVNPSDINYSQRTVSEIRVFDPAKYEPIRVIEVEGQLVSYDNRRLLSAQNAGITEIEVELVNPSDPFPKSTTGKTWNDKFKERFNDKRNKRTGGVISPKGLKSKPVLACS